MVHISGLFLSRKEKQLIKAIHTGFGFKPVKLKYYNLALTHKSAPGKKTNNERLEFLGDSVLSTIISDYLYRHYPKAQEGSMSKMRSRIVKRDVVNKFAFVSGLENLLVYDSGRGISPDKSPDVFGNAFEAFLGAIYLDKGYDFCKKLLLNRFFSKHFDLEEIAAKEENYKGRLLEYAQKHNKELVFESREDTYNGEIEFITIVKLDDEVMGEASAFKKKGSEQKAALDALQKLGLL